MFESSERQRDLLWETQELVLKLDWTIKTLEGVDDEPGILTRLDRLTVETGDGSPDGPLIQAQRLCVLIDQAMERYGRIADLLDQPINDTHLNSIKKAITSGVADNLEQVKNDIRVAVDNANDTADKLSESSKMAGLAANTMSDQVRSAETRITRSVEGSAKQLSAMLDEATSGIKEAIASTQEPIKELMEAAAAEATIDAQKESLQKAWSGVMEGFQEETEWMLKQHRTGLQEALAENHGEQVEQIETLLNGRAPSDAIVALYDTVERQKAQIEHMEKRLSEAKKSAAGRSIPPGVIINLSWAKIGFLAAVTILISMYLSGDLESSAYVVKSWISTLI